MHVATRVADWGTRRSAVFGRRANMTCARCARMLSDGPASHCTALGVPWRCDVRPCQVQTLARARRDGCHHCGKRAGKVVGDHIPPNKLVHGSKAASSLVRQARRARSPSGRGAHSHPPVGWQPPAGAACQPCSAAGASAAGAHAVWAGNSRRRAACILTVRAYPACAASPPAACRGSAGKRPRSRPRSCGCPLRWERAAQCGAVQVEHCQKPAPCPRVCGNTADGRWQRGAAQVERSLGVVPPVGRNSLAAPRCARRRPARPLARLQSA